MLINTIVNTVLNCIMVLLHYHSPQDPIIRGSTAQRTGDRIVRALYRHLVTLPLWQATWGLSSVLGETVVFRVAFAVVHLMMCLAVKCRDTINTWVTGSSVSSLSVLVVWCS